MQKEEKWEGSSGNPSARLRAARSMPQWMETRGGLPTPPPPPPAPDLELTLNDHDPNYEVIDSPTHSPIPSQAYSNTMPIPATDGRGKRCELCGASGPSVLCEQCPQQSFCPSCDEMYHRHPKRQNHIRRAILEPVNQAPRPPLPPKGESPAPVPPPRRNKKSQLPPTGPGTLKRDTGIVGSIKRIITGRSAVIPRAPSLSRDRSASLINNNVDFTRNQMMLGGMESGWTRTGRVGSMTALNMAPGFGPVMHAQSMAHVGCPSCWNWGSQAALHHAGGMHHHPDMLNHPDMHQHPDMHHHGGMMPPPYWYPTWDPRKHRRHHGRPPADTSSEDDEHPSPALSRRSYRVMDSDSDDSFKKSRPQSRRESISDLRKRDEDTMSLRGGRYDDDTRSLRGYRRDSLRRRDDTLDREGRRSRRPEDGFVERGGTDWERTGSRRRPEEDERRIRRRDDDSFSDRGGRRLSDSRYRDEDAWERNSRRSDKSDKKYPPENSWEKPVEKRKDRYGVDSDSDKLPKTISDKKQDRLQEPMKIKEDRKISSNLNKSSETISSVMSSTSGEDKSKGFKKNKLFSDTGQRRRNTDSNRIPNEPEPRREEQIVEEKPIQEKDKEEDDMKPLGPIPTSEWECQHCTYINPPGIRVCEVCCKTKTLETDLLEETTETPMTHQEAETEVKDEPEPPPLLPLEPEPVKKKEAIVEPAQVAQKTKLISLSSKGTSPPPQSISTQTYDVAGLGLKKPSPEVGWSSPKRSFSRQSIVSDTAQSGVSPRSRSPGEIDTQVVEPRQSKKQELVSTINRKTNRGSAIISDHSSMVQKQVNQGLEMVKLLREAEDVGFSGEEVSVAVEHCGDGSPLQWLLENWTHMIDTVVTLATNYGHERKENTIGTVSEREARAALILHQGSVWSAVTEVVQQRQTKYGELLSRGNFSREDIVTALTAHHGDLEAAYTELTKGQLKPFLRRMWPPSNHIGTANHFTH